MTTQKKRRGTQVRVQPSCRTTGSHGGLCDGHRDRQGRGFWCRSIGHLILAGVFSLKGSIRGVAAVRYPSMRLVSPRNSCPWVAAPKKVKLVQVTRHRCITRGRCKRRSGPQGQKANMSSQSATFWPSIEKGELQQLEVRTHRLLLGHSILGSEHPAPNHG